MSPIFFILWCFRIYSRTQRFIWLTTKLAIWRDSESLLTLTSSTHFPKIVFSPSSTFRKVRFWRCLPINNSVYIPCLLHFIPMLNPSQPCTFRSPSISGVYKSLTEWMTSAGQTYRRRIYTKIQVKKIVLWTYAFWNMVSELGPPDEKRKCSAFTLSVNASRWTSVPSSLDRLESFSCCANNLKYSLYSLMHALEFSDFCVMNSRFQISPQIKI